MKKLLTLVLLVIALTFTMTSNVLAQDLTEFLEMYRAIKEEEQRRVEEIQQSPDSQAWVGVFRENMPLDSDVSLYPMCVDCSCSTVSVCAGDAKLVFEGYHRGILGFMTECYAYYYTSRGADMCPQCFSVIEIFEGEHDCFQIHKKCSKGNYDTCPLDVT